MSETEVLDLNVLEPPICTVKIGKRILKAYPLKLRQLIRLSGLQDRMNKSISAEESDRLVVEALSPLIPEIKDDPTLDFSLDEIQLLTAFATKISMPHGVTKQVQETVPTTPKKKSDFPNL